MHKTGRSSQLVPPSSKSFVRFPTDSADLKSATTVNDSIIHPRARRPGMVHTAIGSASNCDSPLDLFPPLQSNFTSNGNLSTFQFSNSIATKRKPVAAPTTTQLPGDSPLSSRFVSLFSHSYSTGASSPYTPMLSTRPPSSTVDSHPHSTVYSGLEPDFDPRLVFPPTIESLNPAVSSWDRSYSSNPSSQDFTVVFGTSTSFNPGTGHSRLGAFTSPVLTQAVRSAFATLVDQTGVSSMNVSLESGSGEKSSDSREPFSFELHSEQTHFVNTRQ